MSPNIKLDDLFIGTISVNDCLKLTTSVPEPEKWRHGQANELLAGKIIESVEWTQYGLIVNCSDATRFQLNLSKRWLKIFEIVADPHFYEKATA